MFGIKLVSWALFLLVMAVLGEELRTSDPDSSRSKFMAAIVVLFLVQLDMLGRYGKKEKPKRLSRGDSRRAMSRTSTQSRVV